MLFRSVLVIIYDGYSNNGAEINDSDQIAWTHKYSCPDPWVADIMFYSDGEVVQITSDPPVQQNVPTINNAGLVAWRRADPEGGQSGIWVWQGGEPALLIEDGRNPRLNNLGDMYFLMHHDWPGTWQGYFYRASDGAIFQLTDDPYWNTDGDIND